MEWTRTGDAVMRKHKLRGALPNTTEDYRALYQLRRHQWGVVRVRHGQKPYLAGLTESFWFKHVEYMLGDKVRGLCAKSPAGDVTASISWPTFLAFDQMVMDHAIKQVNLHGTTLAQAMTDARSDNELRTTGLVTQLAIANSSASSRAPARAPPWATPNETADGGKGGKSSAQPRGNRNGRAREDKGKAKGKGKVKAKGKNKNHDGNVSKLAMARRHNVAKIGAGGSCFAFNKPGGCAKGAACEFKHTCVFCEGSHSIETCAAFARWMGLE